MKKMFLKKNMHSGGITLIALIITVIILLILAGTAISISINGGDIFGKTSLAREEWNVAVKTEEDALYNVLEYLGISKNKGTITFYVEYEKYEGIIEYSVERGTTFGEWIDKYAPTDLFGYDINVYDRGVTERI